ncbi:SPOR domain-containing protein [Dyella sp.]|jgi:cell division protein FtsN|uniref:SPOR domain-containing protein n=1 Tax=Dyella sp. TaxID=1869338 RepID=UPI002D76C226|nr:SPOR domain-containing protein [Dyella sp.]HET6433013.1 SPOR domain-containing protein [Dyella sp.]
MAARKGKGRQAVRNKRGGFPGWGWAAIGILVGVLLMVVLMRKSLLPMAPTGPQPNPQATAQRGSDPGAVAPGAAATTPKKPQYDFYSLLSEKEVRIPDAVISAQAKAEQQKQLAQQQALAAQAAAQQQAQQAQAMARAPAAVSENVQAAPASALPTPAAGSGYLLQVGAFPDSADAESLKAKLALQGFVANVQPVKVGGQTYHRVRLGPFRSATELESTKQRLASAGINAIALKEGH